MRTATLLIISAVLTTAAHAADEVAASPAAATIAANTSVASTSSATAKNNDAGEAKKAAQTDTDAKALSGISILGNQEAPKALVIVPWKSSQLGDPQGISKQLDDGRQPVDKDVFMRELSYYEIRTGSAK